MHRGSCQDRSRPKFADSTHHSGPKPVFTNKFQKVLNLHSSYSPSSIHDLLDVAATALQSSEPDELLLSHPRILQEIFAKLEENAVQEAASSFESVEKLIRLLSQTHQKPAPREISVDMLSVADHHSGESNRQFSQITITIFGFSFNLLISTTVLPPAHEDGCSVITDEVWKIFKSFDSSNNDGITSNGSSTVFSPPILC